MAQLSDRVDLFVLGEIRVIADRAKLGREAAAVLALVSCSAF
jgi:hypothetical protein